MPSPLYFLRTCVFFQRKAVCSPVSGLKHGEYFQSPLPPWSVQPDPQVLPPVLCSRFHFHPPFAPLFRPATGDGSAAKERAHPSSANVWDTGLASHPLEKVRSCPKLAKSPYILKYPLVLAYRKSRCQTWQTQPLPSRQMHPVTTPWG